MWLTAGLFNQAVESGLEQLRGVRQLLAGGEALSVEHVKRALEALPETRLINGYGPTENTTFTACHWLKGTEEEGSVPIGRPVTDTQVYVVEENGMLAMTGGKGELYAGGVGLARGYVNEAGMTGERFVPDAWSGAEGARLYRSEERRVGKERRSR